MPAQTRGHQSTHIPSLTLLFKNNNKVSETGDKVNVVGKRIYLFHCIYRKKYALISMQSVMIIKIIIIITDIWYIIHLAY